MFAEAAARHAVMALAFDYSSLVWLSSVLMFKHFVTLLLMRASVVEVVVVIVVVDGWMDGWMFILLFIMISLLCSCLHCFVLVIYEYVYRLLVVGSVCYFIGANSLIN